MSFAFDKQSIKQLRAIGHKLKPVVTIAGKGITANILEDIDTRLEKNELIKIKINIPDKAAQQAALKHLHTTLHAQLVQHIGKTALLYRQAEKQDPKLSNLVRTNS